MPAVLLIPLVVALAAIGSASVLARRVPAGHAGVRQRMGTFEETLSAGWHLKLPGDRIVVVALAEQVLRVRRRPVTAAAGRQVMVEAEVGYRVVDAYRAVNEAPDDVATALEAAVMTAVRSSVGARDADEMVVSSSGVGENVRRALTEASPRRGVEVSAVEVRFDLPA